MTEGIRPESVSREAGRRPAIRIRTAAVAVAASILLAALPAASSAAVLSPLVPAGDGTRAAVIKDQAGGTTSLFAAMDETIAAADDGTSYIKNDNKTSGSYFALLSDMPPDFTSMTALSIDIRARTTGRVDDSTALYAQVFRADETMPLTAETQVAANPGLSTWTTVSGAAFTGVAAADKAAWDGARLRLRWAYSQVGTADVTQLRLTAVELDGTYSSGPVVNAPPTCQDTTLATAVDTPGTTAPVCSDPNGNALTYAVTQPANGAATVVGGQLRYAPNAGFSGSDSFTYQANDGQENSNAAIVSVTVSANNPPTCQATTLVTTQNTAGTTAPSCSDLDGNALTYSIVTQGLHGTASVVAGPQLRYVPNAGFTGSDSFTYRANDGQANSAAATVAVTVNAAGSGVVVMAAGDIACAPGAAVGSGSCRQQATANLLGGAAAVLPLGDLQYENGTLAEFLGSYDPTWGAFKSITHPAVGNHEYQTAGAAGYFGYFGAAAGPSNKGYYSFDLGAWHIIALNSNCSKVGGCGAGSPQEQWLRSDLAASSAQCTLAYWHHARFSAGGPASSTATAALFQALYDQGAEIVLNGHSHNYQRFAPQTPNGTFSATGVRAWVVGTGGKSHAGIKFPGMANLEVWNRDTFGVLKLVLNPATYSWQFLPEAGKTFTDMGSTSCHN